MQGIFSIARCAQRCNQCPSAHLVSESMPGRVTVLLVDDQPAVRQGLRMRLALEDDLVVVGEAGDGMSALQQAVVPRPNAVVMDLTMWIQTPLWALCWRASAAPVVVANHIVDVILLQADRSLRPKTELDSANRPL